VENEGKKLGKWLVDNNLNAPTLATMMGLEKQSVYYQLKQERVSDSFKHKLSESGFYVFVEKVKHIIPESNSVVNESSPVYNLNSREPLKLIPYYDIDFYGGFEKVFADQKIHPAFFINNPIFFKAEFAVNLSGRSMSGVIPTNAVIGLREIRDWQVYFPSGEIYAIVTKNDMRTVKKIKWDKSRENLILIPEPAEQFKDDYSIEPLDKNFITNFYEVVAWEQFGKLAM